mgnify:CR=1 FL=1
MTEIKLTKKELQAKIESLEKELYLYKNRTQLARNYVILQKEYEEQRVKFYKKRKEWLAEGEVVEVSDEETDEDNL